MNLGFCLITLLLGTVNSKTDTQAELSEDNDDALVETEDGEDKAMYIKFAEDGNVENVFQPTNEWQKVKKGQSIPRGLHVRYNIQTGEHAAKLLDNEDQAKSGRSQSPSKSVIPVEDEEMGVDRDAKNAGMLRMRAALEEATRELEQGQYLEDDGLKYWTDGEKEGMMNLKKQEFSREELKEALKKFKANQDDVQDEKLKEDSLKKSFHSYEELKRDFEQMNMGIKTDYEILQDLVNFFKNPSTSLDQKLSVMQEIEYHVHQVDNAQLLVDMGGFDVIMNELNSTEPALRKEALFVLGAATQSNPKVQVHAMESGVLLHLVKMLATETEASILNRVLYAVSSTLRHFPHAQNKFIQSGSLHTLTQLLSDPITPAKVKIKVTTLVNDLIVERNLASKYSNSENSQESQKVQQYKAIDLDKVLRELSWCQHLPPLLQFTEHDKRERVLLAMTTLHHFCQSSFKETHTKSLLAKLRSEYEELSLAEVKEDDKYFTGVLHIVDNLLKQISKDDHIEL